MIRSFAVLVTITVSTGVLLAQDPSSRERTLQNKLVAACCWSEPISIHRSETSIEMRVQLKHLLDEGKSDAEILAWFKKEYGARVLIEPEGTASLIAYALPTFAAVAGLLLVVFVLRRWVRARSPNPAES